MGIRGRGRERDRQRDETDRKRQRCRNERGNRMEKGTDRETERN